MKNEIFQMPTVRDFFGMKIFRLIMRNELHEAAKEKKNTWTKYAERNVLYVGTKTLIFLGINSYS